jgi:hypothetical protein
MQQSQSQTDPETCRGTLQVFHLHNEGKLYGAIETGVHDFYIKEPDKALYETNVGLFTNVWLKTKKSWQLRPHGLPRLLVRCRGYTFWNGQLQRSRFRVVLDVSLQKQLNLWEEAINDDW